MANADLNEDDLPTWEENFQPPPWTAEPDEDFGPIKGMEDVEAYHVVSHGYDDETPIVCAGTKHWPLWREQALILAASLDLLKVARVMLDHARSGEHFSYPLGSLQMLEEAVAKAEGTKP